MNFVLFKLELSLTGVLIRVKKFSYMPTVCADQLYGPHFTHRTF